MSMVLSAIMKLDAGGFTTPMGRVTQGIQTAIRLGGDLADKLVGAFDMGSDISDLAAQTGELPSSLKILQQAFADTGVGAQSTGQILAIMRRNMAQLNDDGSVTIKTFERLGISTEALKKMSAVDQLKVIGEKIKNLKDPADQSAAAMEIFGRSGAKMLTFIKDDKALDTAAQSLGGLPALLDDNANAFDGVSDAIKRIKTKSAGLWAGIAEGALPAADAITSSMDGIDLTGIGRKIGEVMGATVELFRAGDMGQMLTDSLIIGLGEGINKGFELFLQLGDALWQAMSGPLADFSAALGVTIQTAMEEINSLPSLTDKHPWLKASPLISALSAISEVSGLSGFKAQSFGDIREDALGALREFTAGVNDMDPIPLIDVSAEKERWSKTASGAVDEYMEKMKQIRSDANAAAGASAGGTGAFELPEDNKDIKSGGGGGIGIPTDALARIGGFVGGGGSALQGIAERQLGIATRQLDILQGIKDKTGGGAKWAMA